MRPGGTLSTKQLLRQSGLSDHRGEVATPDVLAGVSVRCRHVLAQICEIGPLANAHFHRLQEAAPLNRRESGPHESEIVNKPPPALPPIGRLILKARCARYQCMGHQFTILFVEDDPLVRDVVVALLHEHGFRVLVAEDGYEAIRLLVEYQVDLLFTDVVMPGISGFELGLQAKLIRSNLRVLYITGYADQAAGKGIRYGKVLQKPVRADELLAEITRALAA